MEPTFRQVTVIRDLNSGAFFTNNVQAKTLILKSLLLIVKPLSVDMYLVDKKTMFGCSLAVHTDNNRKAYKPAPFFGVF